MEEVGGQGLKRASEKYAQDMKNMDLFLLQWLILYLEFIMIQICLE